MSGTRQKIQYSLALVPEGRGEAPGRGYQGTEPPVAKPAPERPACAEQSMEEVSILIAEFPALAGHRPCIFIDQREQNSRWCPP